MMKSPLLASFALSLALASLSTSLAHAQPDAPPAPTDTPPTAPAPTEPTPTETTPTVTPAPDSETVIEITSNRNPRPLSQATSAVTVITRRQIEQRKAVDLTDILQLSPGVSVSQNGGRGQLSSIFIRGAAPRESLVLIDGVRVNAQSFGGFDLSTVPAETVERVEILRGPQAGLYGSDSLGGVVNIITRRASGPLRAGTALELGNQGTNRQVATLRGDLGGGNLSFSLSRFGTDNRRSNEDFRNFDSTLRYDRPLTDKLALSFTGRFDRNNTGVPGSTFFPDPNETNKLRSAFGSVQLTRTTTRRRDLLRFGLERRTLRDDNPENPGDQFPFSSQSASRDRVLTLEAQSALALGRNTLTLGGEVRREAAHYTSAPTSEYDRGTSTRSLFALYEARLGKVSLVPSVRYEDNSKFGGQLGGRFAAAYNLAPQTRLKASIGNGYRIPTLDQLFFPGFSNPDLNPERSTGYDVGVEHNLAGGTVEVTLFRNRFRNLIDFPPPNFVPLNVERAQTQGIELGFSKDLGGGFRAVVNHTFLDSDAGVSQYLVRRPKFATTADLLLRRNKFDFDLGLVAQGRRKDVGASGVDNFGGFVRFDLSAGYNIASGVQLYARLNNALNRDYAVVAGYPSPRRTIVVGVQTGVF